MSKELERLIGFFKEISNVPRDSAKEDKIADYLEKFAKKRNLECYRDINNNVLIKKKGTKGDNKTLILQAHTDMVCVKTNESKHDFTKDPIEIIQDGDILKAKDTSLGADDAIGMSFIIFVLDSKDINHPNLECLFTTEEETNFNGVSKFDYDKLSGNALINFDNDKDDTIVVGCAGDIATEYLFIGKKETTKLKAYKIKIDNLKGGNSGGQVSKNRTNAITLMAKIIKDLQKYGNVYLNTINGGTSETNIADSSECIINTEINDVEEKIKKYISQYNFVDEEADLEVCDVKNDIVFSLNNSNNIIDEILNISKGIIIKNDIEVITSENIGIIKTEDNKITIKHLLRSINEIDLLKYNEENNISSEKYNFTNKNLYKDNIWISKEESKLKDIYAKAYYNINSKNPDVVNIHAGIECSTIAKKRNNLELISVGTIIENTHSTNERIYISSCEKVLKILIEFLRIY